MFVTVKPLMALSPYPTLLWGTECAAAKANVLGMGQDG